MNGRCSYITKNSIEKAFKIAVKDNKYKISQNVLVNRVCQLLHLTKDQLKANYITAFLVCYMNDIDWIYNAEQETFYKVTMNQTTIELLRGMKHAGYSAHQIADVKMLLTVVLHGEITSAMVDPREVIINNKERNRRIVFRKDEF